MPKYFNKKYKSYKIGWTILLKWSIFLQKSKRHGCT